MVVDMGYWTKVGKRILILTFTILGIYLAFKLAIFYMPFLIAFIISLLIEPIIKFVSKKTSFTRKTSAIIVLMVVASILIGFIAWGITSLIAEASNLLQGLNQYIEKAYTQVQDIMNNIDFTKLKISSEVTNVIQNSAGEIIGTISNWVKNGLTSLMNGLTQIPTIAIYIGISFIAIYFICTDKLYMIDQLEHHLPKEWVKRIGYHIRELISSLGGYLKAEAILVIISFIISLIGLYGLTFMGFSIKYPLLAALGIGFVDALPILGSGTAMVPWSIIAAINGDIRLSVAILILWIIMSIIRQFAEPRVVSTHIGIHPIFTLIAMYTGFKIMGVLGMFIGPIILIILKNIFSTLIDKGVGKAIFDR
ncbi:MAG: sporulation integral membrane protein YtvI [Clostridia bacterium]|nr:sporulation integral membrane protein YtvI [Clostridia bacterium]